ncbi:restriction endonuclease subunit S, partial [Klebsiella pneumoniae]|nr:restriction endonuclease subunit S [Klebsiella pneumoniae]
RSLTKSDFLSLEVPFPPINDQARIANLLAKVEGLIEQRKQLLQYLDDLLKSVFVDMFSDPVKNAKGWELTTIGELAVDVRYGT